MLGLCFSNFLWVVKIRFHISRLGFLCIEGHDCQLSRYLEHELVRMSKS